MVRYVFCLGKFLSFFFKKNFGGHMSLYGATDTPVLDLWSNALNSYFSLNENVLQFSNIDAGRRDKFEITMRCSLIVDKMLLMLLNATIT